MKASKIVLVLLVIWQLPQLLIGFILSQIFRDHTEISYPGTRNGFTAMKCRTEFSFCFSLGWYVFAPQCVNDEVLKHEIGHSIQSRYLGPAYLIVIGLTSLILFWMRRLLKKDMQWYHNHFPENWANKLGNVRSEFYKPN